MHCGINKHSTTINILQVVVLCIMYVCMYVCNKNRSVPSPPLLLFCLHFANHLLRHSSHCLTALKKQCSSKNYDFNLPTLWTISKKTINKKLFKLKKFCFHIINFHFINPFFNLKYKNSLHCALMKLLFHIDYDLVKSVF
jgi:hypothetical protein